MNEAAEIIKQLPVETPMHAMMYIMLGLLTFITLVLFVKFTGLHYDPETKKLKFSPHPHINHDPNAECPYTKTRDKEMAFVKNIEEQVKNIEEQFAKIILDLNSIKEQSNETRADLKDVIIDQQKQLFVDERQSPEERLIAGLRYLYHGQNGALKTQMLRFISEHREAYNSIVKLKPELAVKGIGLTGSDLGIKG